MSAAGPAPADLPAPPPLRLLARGLTRRCPVCGERRIFEPWSEAGVQAYFRLRERCPRCGLRFQRLEGQWSGDIGINTIVTFSLLYVVMLGGTLLMWGDINVPALAVAAGLVTFVFPVLFVPFAKTLWVAIDLVMRPLQPEELTGGRLPGAPVRPARGNRPAAPRKSPRR